MYHGIFQNASLYQFFYRVDCEIADSARKAGCPYDDGPLHRADYPRKPRGVPSGLDKEYERRKSFCCGREGCRHRMTPPSVRFLGRKVYVGAVIVLCTAMQHGVNHDRAQQLWELLGISRQTLKRWRMYWLQTFPATPFWKEARARFSPPVEEGDLPLSLLTRFAGELMSQLCLLMQFLLPITTGSAGNRERNLRGVNSSRRG